MILTPVRFLLSCNDGVLGQGLNPKDTPVDSTRRRAAPPFIILVPVVCPLSIIESILRIYTPGSFTAEGMQTINQPCTFFNKYFFDGVFSCGPLVELKNCADNQTQRE